LVALPGLEPGLFALRGRRVNQLHHNAVSNTSVRIGAVRLDHLAPMSIAKHACRGKCCRPRASGLDHRLDSIRENMELILRLKVREQSSAQQPRRGA
jgi:hypothetical protein